MRRVMIAILASALAGIVAPAAAVSNTHVDYWLDRDPGTWTGGMVVIRRGGKYWAYAKFFEGRVCLSGHRAGSTVRMKGTFEQFEKEEVRLTWRILKGVPKVEHQLGTPGEWRRVSRSDFVAGTTTGHRLIQTARVTTPARWRSACAWTQSFLSNAGGARVYMIQEQGCFDGDCLGAVASMRVHGRSVRFTMISSQANTVYSIGTMQRRGRTLRGWSGSECYRSKRRLAVRGTGSRTRFPGFTVVSRARAEAFAAGLYAMGPIDAADRPGVTRRQWRSTYERICS